MEFRADSKSIIIDGHPLKDFIVGVMKDFFNEKPVETHQETPIVNLFGHPQQTVAASTTEAEKTYVGHAEIKAILKTTNHYVWVLRDLNKIPHTVTFDKSGKRVFKYDKQFTIDNRESLLAFTATTEARKLIKELNLKNKKKQA